MANDFQFKKDFVIPIGVNGEDRGVEVYDKRRFVLNVGVFVGDADKVVVANFAIKRVEDGEVIKYLEEQRYGVDGVDEGELENGEEYDFYILEVERLNGERDVVEEELKNLREELRSLREELREMKEGGASEEEPNNKRMEIIVKEELMDKKGLDLDVINEEYKGLIVVKPVVKKVKKFDDVRVLINSRGEIDVEFLKGVKLRRVILLNDFL